MSLYTLCIVPSTSNSVFCETAPTPGETAPTQRDTPSAALPPRTKGQLTPYPRNTPPDDTDEGDALDSLHEIVEEDEGEHTSVPRPAKQVPGGPRVTSSYFPYGQHPPALTPVAEVASPAPHNTASTVLPTIHSLRHRHDSTTSSPESATSDANAKPSASPTRRSLIAPTSERLLQCDRRLHQRKHRPQAQPPAPRTRRCRGPPASARRAVRPPPLHREGRRRACPWGAGECVRRGRGAQAEPHAPRTGGAADGVRAQGAAGTGYPTAADQDASGPGVQRKPSRMRRALAAAGVAGGAEESAGAPAIGAPMGLKPSSPPLPSGVQAETETPANEMGEGGGLGRRKTLMRRIRNRVAGGA
ncbi:hypothetical protein C8J57DRAFT_1707081 [Mycena rebaudengoi]|nr:hypothetical protein C8J57DRAFT_1707081 [Mycena rebaudengoi]